MHRNFSRFFVHLKGALAVLLLGLAAGTTPTFADSHDPYLVQSADVLSISVWKETDLQLEVLVRPDGFFTFPLAGEIQAKGRSIADIQADIVENISEYIPDPVVTVALLQSLGNKVFVLGKVNRPGEFPLTQDMDVMQALALGGGLATFADEDRISILRRVEGVPQALPFDYKEVSYGRALEQNILLEPGDVVVVP